MKISIVTVSYNQADYLEETIRSVLSQRHDALEYIIIDGGSTDRSVEIIRKYENHLAYWESSADRGQVHALNKGLEHVTGDVFAFLNSDDVYLPGAFSAVMSAFEARPEVKWLCGDTLMFGQGHATQLIQSVVPKTVGHALAWAFKAPQPGMFWRTELVRAGFDEAWSYAFDQDMYVRLLLDGFQCVPLPIPLAAYRLHASSKTVTQYEQMDDEADRIAIRYEPRLSPGDQRWSVATRNLRASYALALTDRGQSARLLGAALRRHTRIVVSRPFWGCFRRLIAAK